MIEYFTLNMMLISLNLIFCDKSDSLFFENDVFARNWFHKLCYFLLVCKICTMLKPEKNSGKFPQ